MAWKLSRFRAGDLVEVRSKQEILATLDEHGRLEGMPFMPEMLQYCGQRIRVGAVAHKTCETARKTYKARRLNTTVHLAGIRCDGSGHGGCEAECMLFWKDAWLKATGKNGKSSSTNQAPSRTNGCHEDRLVASTRVPQANGQEPLYSCQATELYDATLPLAWWDPRQYARDVVTGNHSIGHVLRVLCVNVLKHCNQKTPIAYRLLKAFREWVHGWLMRRDIPDFQGVIARNQPTPTGRLDLQPGDRVRIKPKAEIVKTLHVNGENRGLYFDVEMSPYCGSVRTVGRAVTKIIEESSGRMLHMKQPCIILEGVVCHSEYTENRLMCPRAFPSYWREIWLERVESAATAEPKKRFG